jgi:indole-3-glycerol phosphate synthase/phosphoribosylanthranilate isomerase
MDQGIDEILDSVRPNSLSAVQLHGAESSGFVADLKRQLGKNIQIWKAVSVSDTDDAYPSSADLPALIADWRAVGVDKILVDTPKTPGPHSLDYSQVIDQADVMLAGAVDINSDLLLAECRVAGLDICSALEQEPGQKDHQKLTELFKKLEVKTRNE